MSIFIVTVTTKHLFHIGKYPQRLILVCVSEQLCLSLTELHNTITSASAARQILDKASVWTSPVFYFIFLQVTSVT